MSLGAGTKVRIKLDHADHRVRGAEGTVSFHTRQGVWVELTHPIGELTRVRVEATDLVHASMGATVNRVGTRKGVFQTHGVSQPLYRSSNNG